MQTIDKLKDRVEQIKTKLKYDDLLSKFKELEKITTEPNFWDNPTEAQEKMQNLSNIKADIDNVNEVETKINDLDAYAELLETDDSELQADYQKLVDETSASIDALELTTYFSNKYDQYNAIISIHAGQGGTEANDWSEMLMRMYLRFFERRGWKAEIINMVKGNEAGIGTVSIEVTGRYVYGYLKGEHGTHRLVRISPFNAQGLRQTSFAGVEVIPLITSDVEIEIKPEDIDFHAVRSGGAGGQNVNKVNTAARITHIPTGIQVHCSSERSQLRNRESAMQILRGKLLQIELEKRAKEQDKLVGSHKIAGWGNQIRNYVLQPYKLVKDLRTQVETDKTENVLDGDIDIFVNATIKL